jgi:hypothetical protein
VIVTVTVSTTKALCTPPGQGKLPLVKIGVISPNIQHNFICGCRKDGNMGLNITDFSGPPHYRFSVDAPEHNLVTTGTIGLL